jgi:hypothetical protein
VAGPRCPSSDGSTVTVEAYFEAGDGPIEFGSSTFTRSDLDRDRRPSAPATDGLRDRLGHVVRTRLLGQIARRNDARSPGARLGAMFQLGEIGFGDNVSIVAAEATRRSGHANLVGVCYGMTTPSATGVEVVGDATDDVALNVHFEDEAVSDAWFAPDLVSLVDHAVGSVATVGDRSFVKAVDGQWIPATSGDAPRVGRRRWFRPR